MAKSNYKCHLDKDEVRLKKYFYVLRSLLAAQWVIDNNTQAPMLFLDLVDIKMEDELKTIVKNLLELKN